MVLSAGQPTKGETGLEPEGMCELLVGSAVAARRGLPRQFSVAGCTAVKRDTFGRRCVLCQRIDGEQETCVFHMLLITVSFFSGTPMELAAG